MGCTNQAGEDNRNVARMGLLLAGLPVEVPGVTVNRLCASGSRRSPGRAQIRLGEADIVLAGGVESMTRAPFVMPKARARRSRAATRARRHHDRLAVRQPADGGAARHRLDGRDRRERRRALRRLARGPRRVRARSHRRALAAAEAGRFDDEIVTVPWPSRRATRHRPLGRGAAPDTTLERSAALRPVFRDGGTVTAGNSSQINDGAACLVLARARPRGGAGPRSRSRASCRAVPGVEPAYMGIGPVPAVRKALASAGLGARPRPGRAQRGVRLPGAWRPCASSDPARAAERERRRDRARASPRAAAARA